MTELTQYDHNQLNLDETPMQQFYRGKSIFLTGATGFLGKVLMEKLLRSTEIETLYILIRPKKGKDANSRIEEIFNEEIFQKLRTDHPKFRQKVVTIVGDCSLPALGITQEDRIRLRTVNVVFHVAAVIRFDEKLRLALLVNVNGTKDVLQLCKEMDQITACVYVSTAYSNSNRPVIDECVYETPITAENMLHLIECMDDKSFDAFAPQLMADWPNVYSFTKCLAENLVNDMGKMIPVTIFRPGIVISAHNEPIPGWIDNIFGAGSTVVYIATGLLRVLHVHNEHHIELVPVDMCVNSLLATAWDRAANHVQSDVPIYNYVATPQNPITWKQFLEKSTRHARSFPLTKTFWYNTSCTTVQTRPMQWLLIFLYHILPALIVDAGLVVISRKPRMMQIYSKIHRFYEVIHYFINRQWKFSNGNVQLLWMKLNERDQKIFFSDIGSLDWDEEIKKFVYGVRKYIIKDDPSTIEAARTRLKRMQILHFFTVYTIYVILLFLLYVIASRVI